MRSLDEILDRCDNFADSLNIFNELENVRNYFEPLLTNQAEKESFVAGTVLAKYSLQYWSENQDMIYGLFENYQFPNYDNSIFKGALKMKPKNPVRADVRGMVTGGIRGAITGGIWGSSILGIGTAVGAITGGIFGAGASGATSSLAAGIWNALIK